MLAEGININITLLFSIAAYERVARAYIAALEARQAAGQPIDRIASVASFFVSRVDTLVDKLLDEKIAATGDATQTGLVGVARRARPPSPTPSWPINRSSDSSLAREWDSGRRRRRGSARSGPSPSARTPPIPDTLYVDTLIGPHTVNTMPRQTIAAFLDHGTVERTIDKDLAGAYKTMADLAAAGIDIDAVTEQLEDEGIASFAKSYDSLLAGVASKRSQLAGAPAD